MLFISFYEARICGKRDPLIFGSIGEPFCICVKRACIVPIFKRIS
uniref:Uncharacterized protein n=1 Tax=Anguilla anguilla TaxID=7936 RepID=A0A0E9QF69_ANGAN